MSADHVYCLDYKGKVAFNCDGCEVFYFACLRMSEFDILQFYINHGVYRQTRLCGNILCRNKLAINKIGDFYFRCGNYYQPRLGVKKVKCQFVANALAPFLECTFFKATTVPVINIFYFVGTLLFFSPPRNTFLKSNFDLSEYTIAQWNYYCREVFFDHVYGDEEVVGGVDHVVEIYEATFGNREYGAFNCQRKIEGQWVYGGIDRETHKTFLIPVKSRGKEMLLAIINERIAPGTTILTDDWGEYLSDEGFNHQKEKYAKSFINIRNHIHRNNIKTLWRSVHHVKRKHHLVGYLAEYLFKAKYVVVTERIHHFWLAAAQLYLPRIVSFCRKKVFSCDQDDPLGEGNTHSAESLKESLEVETESREDMDENRYSFRPRKKKDAENVIEDRETEEMCSRPVIKCCAMHCTNTSDSSIMCEFPKNRYLKQLWVDQINRDDWAPHRDSAVCRIHFEDDMWQEGDNGEMSLRSDAVPTLFFEEAPSEETRTERENTGSASPDLDNSFYYSDDCAVKDESVEQDIDVEGEEGCSPEELPTSTTSNDQDDTMGFTADGQIVSPELMAVKTEPAEVIEVQEVHVPDSPPEFVADTAPDVHRSSPRLAVSHARNSSSKRAVLRWSSPLSEQADECEVSPAKKIKYQTKSRQDHFTKEAGTSTVPLSTNKPPFVTSQAMYNMNRMPVSTTSGPPKLMPAPVTPGGNPERPQRFLVFLPKTPGQRPRQVMLPPPRPPPLLAPPLLAPPQLAGSVIDGSETFSISLAQFSVETRIAIKRKLVEVVNSIIMQNLNPSSLVNGHIDH